MNYHYIDYMIKARRREELAECERQRVLNSSGYSQAVLIRKAVDDLVNAVRRLRIQWTRTHRLLYPYGPMVKTVGRTRRSE
jgi:hypothetical protein